MLSYTAGALCRNCRSAKSVAGSARQSSWSFSRPSTLGSLRMGAAVQLGGGSVGLGAIPSRRSLSHPCRDAVPSRGGKATLRTPPVHGGSRPFALLRLQTVNVGGPFWAWTLASTTWSHPTRASLVPGFHSIRGLFERDRPFVHRPADPVKTGLCAIDHDGCDLVVQGKGTSTTRAVTTCSAVIHVQRRHL